MQPCPLAVHWCHCHYYPEIGIDEKNPGDLAVYPIPSNGLIKLNTNGLESGEVTLRLTNLQGQLIREMILEVNGQETIELDLSEQATGAYMLNLTDSKGKHYVQKITLE
ncbi:MAG: T9SS type A sorting domain-containing protein [Owenweeksia sp.]|nr:T9SS type A sorting domain-containing protein [Owenweeksia sp.]